MCVCALYVCIYIFSCGQLIYDFPHVACQRSAASRRESGSRGRNAFRPEKDMWKATAKSALDMVDAQATRNAILGFTSSYCNLQE